MPRLTTTFGRTWWSQRWLRPLDDLDPELDGRLARGRTYARDGHILQRHIEPGAMLATIQGSYWEQYTVTIEIPVLADDVWERIVRELAGDTLTLATLLAGGMPEEIEATIARAGGRLFPLPTETRAFCPCPDPTRPCKHIFAAFYDVAASLDHDPFLLLLTRGRSRQDLLAAVRASWTGAQTVGLSASVEVSADAPGLRAARYYTQAPMLDDFVLAIEAPAYDAEIVRRLGPLPFTTAEEDVLAALTPVYQAITRHALRAAAQRSPKSPRARRQTAVSGEP